MRNTFVALVIAAIWIGTGQTSQAPTDASVGGEWRSVKTIGDRPEVTLTLSTNPALSGSIVFVGERKGERQWTTLKLERLWWDGTALTFDATLPEGEGDVHWTLRSEAANKGTLTAVADDASPHEDPVSWDMVRR